MLKEFKSFLTATNALAIDVIIGAAVGKVVGSLESDIMMPLISLIVPGGAWRDLKLVLPRRQVLGHFGRARQSARACPRAPAAAMPLRA